MEENQITNLKGDPDLLPLFTTPPNLFRKTSKKSKSAPPRGHRTRIRKKNHSETKHSKRSSSKHSKRSNSEKKPSGQDLILESITTPEIKIKTPKKQKYQNILRPQKERLQSLLNKVCINANYCIPFGNYQDHINSYFNGFTKFDYLTKFPKELSSGANGTVLLCEYDNQGYTSNTILKFSNNMQADNLLYEYFVGMTVINDLCKFFPCFLETYGLYKIRNNAVGQRLKNDNTHEIDINVLKDGMALIPVSSKNTSNIIQQYIKESCIDSTDMVIMTQFIQGISFGDLFELKKQDSYFFSVELANILYQIYVPLFTCQKMFIHNDLHLENVIVHQLPSNQYITLRFYFEEQEVIIKTQYIAKIIDYGRCYTRRTETYYQNICKARQCIVPGENCGESKGYSFFDPVLSANNYYISARTPNISHDLRFINSIKNLPGKFSGMGGNEMRRLLAKVKYDHRFGTPPVVSCARNELCNVTSVAVSLSTYVREHSHKIHMNSHTRSKESIGVLDIDLAFIKEMRFHK
jgi:hypothetical protein